MFQRTFTCTELCSYIATNLSVGENIKDAFEEQQIDGEAFLELNENDLKSFNFRLGTIKKMLKLIASINAMVDDGAGDDGSISDFDASSVLHSSMNSSASTVPVPSSSSCGSASSSVITRRKSASLLSTDLRAKLGEYPQGSVLLEQLDDADQILSDKSHRLVVKRCVDILVNYATETGFQKYYPSTNLKIQMAQKMTEEFPKLKYKGVLTDIEGHEHYYDAASRTGFLENRLKTLRKKLPVEDKMYRQRGLKRKNSDLSAVPESVECREKINWMKNNLTSTQNEETVFEYMGATFNMRRQYILTSSPSAHDVLTKFPRFIDTSHGELFLIEFRRIFPQSTYITQWFPEQISSLIKLHEKKNLKEIIVEDVNLKGVLALLALLPPLNTARQEDPIIVDFVKGFPDMTEYASTHPNRKQPFLMCTTDVCNNYFIIIDNIAIPTGTHFLSSFEKLFCLYYTFNVRFFTALSPFYNFFETFTLNRKPMASVCRLNQALSRIDFHKS